MKKGFTLIELLAIIVILAIITLIATPIILNIISNAKIETNEINKELYLDAVKDAVARKNLTEEFNPEECIIQSDGDLLCKDSELLVEVNGIKPCSGKITFDEKGKITSDTVTYCDGDDGTEEPIVPEPKSFKDDDWSTIISNVKAGNTDVYNVGDEKTIELTGEVEGTYTVRIVNKSNNIIDKCGTDGFSETACGFVIEFKDIITMHNMNTENKNTGGWEQSEMRTYINNTIFKSLPIELQNGIIDTKVISGYEKDASKNYITIDKLYLLSTHELWVEGSSDNVSEYDTAYSNTRQLDYYNGVTTDSGKYSQAKKNYEGVATNWWLRSAYFTTSSGFYRVNTYGYWNYNTATTTNGVSPAFRLSE